MHSLRVTLLVLAVSACTGTITTEDGDDIEGLVPGADTEATPDGNPGSTGSPTEPGTTPTEPGTTPTEPGTTPTEPEPTPTEPEPTPTEPGSQLVPNNAYCVDVANWPESSTALEDEILEIVNAERAQGATCGQQVFASAPPLTMNPALRCAARKHSLDMAENNYFDHTNLEGELPWDRMELAGYDWSNAAENIAGGSSSAQGAMNQWMSSPGHCSNIMNPGLTEIGVGLVPNLWTQVLARPR